MAPTSPNVLIIMADQLNPRVLSAYGGPVSTPGFDQICEAGLIFDSATTTSPLCSPARASVITGLYPHAHGIVHNVMSQDFPTIASSGHDRGIAADDQTTEQLLHAAGYATHHRGRWHLSDEPVSYYSKWYREMYEYAEEIQDHSEAAKHDDDLMNWYGWSLPVTTTPEVKKRFAAITSADCDNNHQAAVGDLQHNSTFTEFVGKMGHLRWAQEYTFDYRVASETIKCIEAEAKANRPFMITCSFNNPHDPNIAPSPFYESIDPSNLDLPPSFRTAEERHKKSDSWKLATQLGVLGIREYLRIYYAQVLLLDAQIQRLLSTLARWDLEHNTIVVFLSDHGDMASAHGMIWKNTESFYDEIVQVPLAIRWPASISPRRDNRCVSLVDVMPTLLEAVNIRPNDPIQGRSLLGFDARDWPTFAVSQRYLRHDSSTRRIFEDDEVSIMIRTHSKKLVIYHDGDEEMFDLDRDPHELTNIVHEKESAQDRSGLFKMLVRWMFDMNHPRVAQIKHLEKRTGSS